MRAVGRVRATAALQGGDVLGRLARLRQAEGTVEALGVGGNPCGRGALEAPQREGLVYMRTHTVRLTTGCLAVQMWYDVRQKQPWVRDCARMTFEGLV